MTKAPTGNFGHACKDGPTRGLHFGLGFRVLEPLEKFLGFWVSGFLGVLGFQCFLGFQGFRVLVF